MKGRGVRLCMAACLIALTGCAHAVSPELRAEATPGLTFPMVLENPSAYMGATVIWGGLVVGVRNRVDNTTLTVLETPLDEGERPEDREYSRGRFLATTRHYLDPAIYRVGTRVTVAGKVAGEEARSIGEKPYLYPVVAIEEIHLWKRRIVVYGGPYDWGPYPYGWWGPYPYSGWGPYPWWDTYWYATPGRFGEGPDFRGEGREREGGVEHRGKGGEGGRERR
jgi:outer membrane lipoprotein